MDQNSKFGFKKPQDSAGFSLWQVTTIWQRRIKETLKPYDISHAQFVVNALSLWLTEQGQEVSQSELIKLSKLDKMTVSKALRKSSSMGLITHKESNNDSRAKTISVTEHGKATIKKLIPQIEGIDSEFFGKLSSWENRVMRHYFHKLSKE